MARYTLLIFTVLFCSFGALAQPGQQEALAQQYYQLGEFDKAADFYEQLFDESPGNQMYYRYLYNSLIAIREFDRLEKIVKKARKNSSDELSFNVDLGYILIQRGDVEAGKKEFDDALEDLANDEGQARRLANAFVTYNEYDYAIRAYEKLRKERGDNNLFAFELAFLYEQKNDVKNAIRSYLDFVESQPGNIQGVKNTLQRKMDDEKYRIELQTQLYGKIQKSPQSLVFPDLLIWLFIQQKDFESAFIQVKALDKRLNENGIRVLELARSAAAEEDYDAAIKSYEYIINEKGKAGSLYLLARQEILKARKDKIARSANFTSEDLIILEKAYLDFLNEFGNNPRAYQTEADLARLEAFYLHDLDTAIAIMAAVVAKPYLNHIERAEAKLDLGDFYLMKGEIWEATLLYSQVDKSMRDEPLGEVARYKNAKLSYYKGEFEWAQTQLEVLKGATSELIANDAIDLSVFILDNLGLDTTMLPMLMFAKADLLIYQKKYDESLAKLDSLSKYYPRHTLADDILYAKARIAMDKREFQQASVFLTAIIENHAEDILGDDSKFRLAELNEQHLGNKEAAMKLYEDIIINHSGSIYVVEARKRYRNLRGDQF